MPNRAARDLRHRVLLLSTLLHILERRYKGLPEEDRVLSSALDNWLQIKGLQEIACLGDNYHITQ